MPRGQRIKNLVEDSIPGLCCPTCGDSSCEWGLTGPFSSDGLSLALHLWLWAGALGKGELSAPGTEPESRVALGCLEECVDAGRSCWWGTGGQAQVAENLDDARGVCNGGEDGQGSPALRTGGDVDGEDAFEPLGPTPARPW